MRFRVALCDGVGLVQQGVRVGFAPQCHPEKTASARTDESESDSELAHDQLDQLFEADLKLQQELKNANSGLDLGLLSGAILSELDFYSDVFAVITFALDDEWSFFGFFIRALCGIRPELSGRSPGGYFG